MLTRIFCLFLFLITTSIFLFSCINTTNPFEDYNNVQIGIALKNAKGLPMNTSSITDSIGSTIQIGPILSLANLVDSVYVTIKKYKNNKDSIYKFNKSDLTRDTLWCSFSFSKTGNWVFSAIAFLPNGDNRKVTGDITILPKSFDLFIKPIHQIATIDSMSTITVEISGGDAPFSYLWYHDTLPLRNDTNVMFIRTKFSIADTGVYTCLVSDKWGDTIRTSQSTFTLIAKKQLLAAISPISDSKLLDSSMVFAVTAIGDTPFIYKWFHGSSEISGQTSFNLVIGKLAFSDSGEYKCFVKNKNGDTITCIILPHSAPDYCLIRHPVIAASGTPIFFHSALFC